MYVHPLLMMTVNIVVLFCSYFRVGAAIVVDVQEYSVPLSDLAGNPQCFLVYEDLQARPDQWDDVSVCLCVCMCVVCACVRACVYVCMYPPFV